MCVILIHVTAFTQSRKDAADAETKTINKLLNYCPGGIYNGKIIDSLRDIYAPNLCCLMNVMVLYSEQDWHRLTEIELYALERQTERIATELFRQKKPVMIILENYFEKEVCVEKLKAKDFELQIISWRPCGYCDIYDSYEKKWIRILNRKTKELIAIELFLK